MHLSCYLLDFPWPDDHGRRLLFSTRQASLALLPTEEWTGLQQGKIDDETAATLAELGMLVPDVKEEREEILSYLDKVNHLNRNLTVAVILGMECNFACRYCYEGTLKGPQAMDDETAGQLIAFIKKRFTADKKKLRLDFYGGEPLLYIKRIKHLAQALKPMVEERGGQFGFNLVTNGSLLRRSIVEELKGYGLRYAKVTLDGPPENHNRFRPFKNGQPSFEAIVDNLKESCAVIDIGLAGNYTSDNYQTFPALLDQLANHGLTPDRFERVNFNMVMRINDAFANPEFSGGCSSLNEPWLVEASLQVREETMKRGYRVPELTISPCAMEVADNLTVHFDGAIYKCAALVGREQYRVGDVWHDINDFSESHDLFHWQREEKCRQCVYLPLCFGGCRYMKYLRNGSMTGVDCQKPYLDAALETMLKQQIRYQRPRAGSRRSGT